MQCANITSSPGAVCACRMFCSISESPCALLVRHFCLLCNSCLNKLHMPKPLFYSPLHPHHWVNYTLINVAGCPCHVNAWHGEFKSSYRLLLVCLHQLLQLSLDALKGIIYGLDMAVQLLRDFLICAAVQIQMQDLLFKAAQNG